MDERDLPHYGLYIDGHWSDAADGKLLWKNADAALLSAIGSNGPAQHYVTGYATTWPTSSPST